MKVLERGNEVTQALCGGKTITKPSPEALTSISTCIHFLRVPAGAMDQGLFQSPQFLASKELESRGSVDTPIRDPRKNPNDLRGLLFWVRDPPEDPVLH
ncbi:hypothetical protein LguiA_015041 [Lonicera macranthoides]